MNLINPVKILQGNGDKIIVAFTGRTPEQDENTKAEWSNILREHYKVLISFNDSSCKWYTDDHWPNTISETLAPYTKVDVAIGVSMGGWAVIFFKDLLKTDRIRAIAPQSFVNVKQWQDIGPRHVAWSSVIDDSIDLKLSTSDTINIMAAFGGNPEDIIHSENMRSWGFDILNVKSKSHVVVNRLRKNGYLFEFLFNN